MTLEEKNRFKRWAYNTEAFESLDMLEVSLFVKKDNLQAVTKTIRSVKIECMTVDVFINSFPYHDINTKIIIEVIENNLMRF
mgnify:FL=1